MLELQELTWPVPPAVLVLAPHPDDFDAIAVSLRYFRDRDSRIRLVVVSSSPAGVEDSFCTPATPELKAAIREHEQLESCTLFGLQPNAITFLRLSDGDEQDDVVAAQLRIVHPDLVFLPHGNDSNAGHRATWAMFRRCRNAADWAITALLNRDPKTLGMREDVHMFFGEEEARWKASLLRCHHSQHQRNLNTRGYGFDERILRLNREVAARFAGKPAYAEAFEIWR